MMLFSELYADSTEAHAPGSSEWVKYMTASKVSAVMRHSPWQSRFSLWHEMAGNVDMSPIDESVLVRGHILEPAVASWFALQHPEFNVVDPKGRWWVRGEWAAATPDRIVTEGSGDSESVVGLLEIKTARSREGWGVGDTPLPAYYFDQVQWQMFCTGVSRVFVAVLFGGLDFEEFVIERDDDYIDGSLVPMCESFVDSLRAGEVPDFSLEAGDFDVYECMRFLHPEIDGSSIVLSHDAAVRVMRWVRMRKLASRVEAEAKAWAAHDMEFAKFGVVDGEVVVVRRARGSGRPFVQFGK